MLKLAFFLLPLNMLFAGTMNPVSEFIIERTKEFSKISSDRKSELEEISKYISTKLNNNEQVNLTFICTHNSRRSHIAQIFTQAGSDFYNLRGIKTYSGGTESTAFNPRAVAALVRVGFGIDEGEGENPVYSVRWTPNMMPLECFSKKFDDEVNPDKDFAAIMVCSSADEACPYVAGADQRFAIPYNDPKQADGTEKEAKAYNEKAKEIAREMIYMLSQANKMIKQ